MLYCFFRLSVDDNTLICKTETDKELNMREDQHSHTIHTIKKVWRR